MSEHPEWSRRGRLRRLAGAVTAVVVLVGAAGCGHENDDDPAAAESATATSQTSTESTTVSTVGVIWRTLAVVSESGVGGRTSQPETLATAAQQNAFLSQFGPASSDDPATGFVQRLQSAIDRAEVGEDDVIVGAIVDVSCEPVDEVGIHSAAGALEITPIRSSKPSAQCLVPITSVALVVGPADQAP